MKQLIWVMMVLWAAVSIKVATAAGPFIEGKHYIRLSGPAMTMNRSTKIEVAEVFWYGCPSCNRFEPSLLSWLEKKSDNIDFVRLPASLNRSWAIHARAFYTAELLGKFEATHEALFHAMHRESKRLNTEGSLQEFFARHDVDAETFRKTFHSFAVETKLRRADQLVRHYRITGVPAMVVNGAYWTSPSLAGGTEQALSVVDYLISLSGMPKE